MRYFVCLFSVILITLSSFAGIHDPVRIVAFGDSTTAPRMVDGQALRVYADVLRDTFTAERMPVTLANAGVGGDTTAKAARRFEKDVMAQQPDLAIIQFGLNDSAVDVHRGKETPRVGLKEYTGNLRNSVETLQKEGVNVILMTPNPRMWSEKLKELYGGPPYDPDERWGFNRGLDEYVNAVRSVAENTGVVLVDIYARFMESEQSGGKVEALLLDGLHPNTAGQALVAEALKEALVKMDAQSGLRRHMPKAYTIPFIDLADETDRQVLVDREKGQYLGHPTTVLLEDNRTMICVYPKGHGRGAIVMKRSEDAGLNWSERLPVPENWATSKEVPTIYRVIDRQGVKRLIMFSGLYPIRMAVSEDDGKSWSPLEPIGDFGGIVAMGSCMRLKNGDYMALFHDDGRFFRADGKKSDPIRFYVYKTVSKDGGLTWGEPEVIAHLPYVHLCEPGALRSPDGSTIAVLLRENSRTRNSYVVFSEDEGATWTVPREVTAALTGDRHTAKYAPDGRIFISFRDTTHVSPSRGDWAGWVGTWEDIVNFREGQYRVRLMDNHKGMDCTYPGVEVLPDGTFVTTTYGHWAEGEAPWIMSVRFRLDELDAKAAEKGR